MPVYAALNSFNAGELSPKMIGRHDVSQYSKGCITMQNFMVTPYGAAERRPGTRFIAHAKYADRRIRLIRFVFSSTVSYVCEFGDRYIRFFRDAAPVLDGEGTLSEIASPYASSELEDIHFVQSADVMTIVHPSHPVMELKRVEENQFVLSEKEFDYPPMLEPNLDDSSTITPVGTDYSKGASIILKASKDIFTTGNVGGFFQLVHIRKENEISIDFSADGFSDTLEVLGNWTFTTHGTWTGTLTIQRSFDDGQTWNDFRTYSSAKDSNISTDGEEENEGVLYRLRMEDYQQSSSGTIKLCRCLLVNPDFAVTGVVKITALTSLSSAIAVVVKKLGGDEPTVEWNEGAWSDRRGFPRSIAFFEERMIFGGTSARPQTVWASKTNSWDNFLLGDKDDDALEFTLSSDTVNTINWMVQHDALIIGTMDSEWTLSASDNSSALSPSNFRVHRQSVYGSSGTQAAMVGETVLFVQRGRRKVREFVFQWEKDGYTAPDMTILADHITASGISEIAMQQLPDTILWCVLSNGRAAALTYEREQEVIGWQSHVTSGNFKSVAVVPAGDEDQVYFAVERNGRICIEVMASRQQSEDIARQFYVDSGVEVSGNKITTVSNLSHLDNMTVSILVDGSVHRDMTVANGTIDLDFPADHIIVGLPYSSILSPMPIEFDSSSGTSMLRKKTVCSVRIRVYKSVGGTLRCGEDVPQQIISRDVMFDEMDEPISLKSDPVWMFPVSGFSDTTSIVIEDRKSVV